MPLRIDQQTMEERMAEEIAYRKRLPGMSELLGLEAVGCDAEKCQIEIFHKTSDWEKNVNGTIHGGIIAAVLDSSMGILSRCYTYPYRTPTINLNVSYLRAIYVDQTIYVRAELLRQARNLVWLRAVAWTEDPEKPCASAEGTFYCKE